MTRRGRRGGTLIESAIVMAVFAVLIAGLAELSLAGFVSNSASFAARRAARFASLRGSASAEPASAAEIGAKAREYLAPLDGDGAAVEVLWTPDNHPGSTVEVRVTYSLGPSLRPIASGPLTLRAVARQAVVQ